MGEQIMFDQLRRTSNGKAAINSVNVQAAAASAYCESHGGMLPPGYFVIGDGPIIGPKQ